jgi:hypothetical protein
MKGAWFQGAVFFGGSGRRFMAGGGLAGFMGFTVGGEGGDAAAMNG